MRGKRRRREAEITEELAGHLERRQADLMAAGLDAEAARRQARLEFGSTDNYREEARAALGWARWDNFRQDLRDALRQMRRAPGLAIAVVLTLALAMGANTALFSMLYAVLLRPLNYRHPNRIVILQAQLTYPELRALQTRLTAFQTLAAQRWADEFTLLDQGAPRRISALAVTPEFFQVLSAAPISGQVFTRAEYDRGDRNVIVLAYSFWQRIFAGRSEVLGRNLNLDGKLFRIQGIMPRGYANLNRSQDASFAGWIPLQLTPAQRIAHNFDLFLLGRLKPGRKLRQANLQTRTIGNQPEFRQPISKPMQWVRYRAAITKKYDQPIWLLNAAAGLMLLLACLNIAGLLLARNAGRRTEIAMRAVLGASRGRILRQLLAESGLLGIAGCGLGMLAGAWMFAGLRAAAVAAGLPRMQHAGIAGASLALSAALLVLAILLFGLLPAWEASRVNLNSAANQTRRGTPSRSSRRILETLVIGELAFAVALAFGAGLLLRSYAQLTSLPLGFNPHHLLMFSTELPSPAAQPSTPASRQRSDLFIQQALQRLQALPGVRSAGFVELSPFNGLIYMNIQRRNDPHLFHTLVNVAGPHFMRTLGVPILRGRNFRADDGFNSPKVALVNRALAEELWPHQNPIGQELIFGGSRPTAYRVIGEAGNFMQYGPFWMRAKGMKVLAQATVYFPYTQAHPQMYSFLVRTRVPPASLEAEVRRIFSQINPTEPLTNFQTFQQRFTALLVRRRLYLDLLAAMAGLALILVLAGVYGVANFMAGARTGEIGIRKALGAENAAVLRLLLWRTAVLSLIGAALGAGLGLMLARLLTSLLYGVQASDPATLAGVAAFALATAVAGAWVPARRAARLDPLAMLRYE